MKIDFKKLSTSPGYQSLRKAVMAKIADNYYYDTKFSKGPAKNHCFNPTGISNEACKNCFHRGICYKFAWIIGRASHYSCRLNIPVETILNAWEKKRTYCYENYYQDCNFPKLTRADVLVFETTEIAREYIKSVTFRCPLCNGVSTSPHECNSGIVTKNGKKCDWKAYGLFGTLGKGVYIVAKETCVVHEIFAPIAQEVSTS